MKSRTLLLLSSLLLWGPAARADEPVACPDVLKQQQEANVKLAEENAWLQENLKMLQSTSITRADLLRMKLARLQGIAKEVRAQRLAIADFEGYIKWMTGSLSSYAKYVEAGSAAAGVARFLPIPYAGQAGSFAKFVAHFALSLNQASNAIDKYLRTAHQFVARAEALDPVKPLDAKEIHDLGRFADEQLLKDMVDANDKLATTSDLSLSTLSFLEGLNQYISSTDEYWNKTKQFVLRKEVDAKEKSYLSDSIQNLKTATANFSGRLRYFDESTKKSAPAIKVLLGIDDLLRELDGGMASRSP